MLSKKKLISNPRGTKDILPNQASLYQKIQHISQTILNKAGYQPIILPTYEHQELFHTSLGELTDIIQKEMFVFKDRKERPLALRPEGTVSTARLVCQNKLANSNYPLRLYYWGQMFRYERPQRGRYREFWQLGIELINAQGILAEAELLWLTKQFILAFELQNKSILYWNYLGDGKAKQKYKVVLREYLSDKLDNLCLDCNNRYNNNPLRILDCKLCCKIGFPSYSNLLGNDEIKQIKELNKLFDNLKITHSYNEKLVRGLDYYTGIVFELSLQEGENKTIVLGGGRYNKLFQQLSENNLPAAGFALGIDRLANYLTNLEKWKYSNKPDILFIILDSNAYHFVLDWKEQLSKRYKIVSNLEIKKTKNAFKAIDHYLPRLAITIGKKELQGNIINVKDCWNKTNYLVEKTLIVNWIFNYL